MAKNRQYTEDEAVKLALKCLDATRFTKVEKDQKNLKIQQLREEGFSVKTPAGVRRVNSKMLAQGEIKFTSRMKPLDWRLHGTGRPEFMEALVTAGVSTVMQMGGFTNALVNKGGAFSKLYNFGDGYVLLGSNPDEDGKSPIVFMAIPNEGVYWDAFSTVVRGAWGLSATQCCVIFSYEKEEARRLYPDLPEDTHGKIPRTLNQYKDLDRKWEQKMQTEQNECEVAHFFNIAKGVHLIFAGNTCKVIELNQGSDYPFYYHTAEGRKEDFIPVLDFMCLFATEGMYNHGFGEVIYDIAVTRRQIKNMGVNHTLDVADPLWNFNLPKGEGDKFPEKMRLAQELRAQGKKGFITTEYDTANPGGNQVSVNPLMAGNATEEWITIDNELMKELNRFGLNLDDVDYSPNPNQMEIMKKEEDQSSLIKQIQEWNSTEYQKAVEFTLEMIKRYVSKNDKTPLNLTTAVKAGDVEFKMDDATLGMVAEELRKYNYFVKVNSRSGAIPSNIMLLTQNADLMSLAQPGSPAFTSLATQRARLNDSDVRGEDFMAPMPTGLPEEPANEPVTPETARTVLTPR